MAENMLLIWRKLTEDEKTFLYNNLTSVAGSPRFGMPIDLMPFISLEETLAAYDNFSEWLTDPKRVYQHQLAEPNIRRKLEE